MSIKKTTSGRWQVDIQIGGRGGKRYQKTFDTKAEALTWEHWLRTKHAENPEWEPAKRDTRKLSELVEIWWQHAGIQLKNGENTRGTLLRMVNALGNPTADRFTADVFASYRTKRLEAGISPNRVNREHAYVRAMFNELRRIKKWNGVNPIADVRQFRIDEPELSFLSLEQTQTLFDYLAQEPISDTLIVSAICLTTGTHWGEAQSLKTNQVHHGAIHLTGTKSGKNRSIPISDELEAMIKQHPAPESANSALFRPCYRSFRRAVERSGIQLPNGQLTHVLRHTFASHFMIKGGNILTLQRILGHSTLTMTMRYAHLAPDHLQEAKNLNIFSALRLC